MHRSSDQAGSGPFHYRLFGLHVESELALPELCPIESSEEPDIRIVVAGPDSHPGSLIDIDNVAKFYVEDGSDICIVPTQGVPERNIRLYLLGSAMGMLLHQRGMLPLHANAVEIDGKAVAYMGPSGSGKSTLAAWLHDRGYRVIADDVCVTCVDGDKAFVLPGLPRLRLWQDALEASGRRASQHERSYAGDESWNKFDVQIAGTVAADAKLQLSLLFDLRRADSFQCSPLAGVEAAESVFANTYRGAFVQASNSHKSHWSAAVALVRMVPVYRLDRHWSANESGEQCERVLSVTRQLLAEQNTAVQQ